MLRRRRDEGARGKLTAAARFWAGGDRIDVSQAVQDAEVLGLPPEAIAQLGATEDHAFEIWDDNWDAWLAFLAISTQWRAIGRADGSVYWQGLDYAGVAAGWRGHGIAETPALWADLRVIEASARNRLNGVMETDQ